MKRASESPTESIPTIAVIDDEVDIVDLVEAYFGQRRTQVLTGHSGSDLRRIMGERRVDLVLLDLGLPGEDGIDLARELRRTTSVPIIILSGRADTVDKVLALELGADDYVTKPFELAELYARARSVLRRAQQARTTVDEPCMRFSGFAFYPRQRRLQARDGTTVELTSGELQMLEVFLYHPNRLLSRDQILEWTRGRDGGPFDRSVDMQIGRLRRKIETDPAAPQLIKTVRSQGYWFSANVERLP
ncbi:MAG: response regulator transcription factor [Mizugakiibacter sp.]|uniref:response regulator transcription factor n=1 Tax=Mizugakiibacter sp. TaxID=1972610 RepID=UPI0031C78904|nr:response regulator transcription factor [Xanthomonadaceae bacterium]